MKVCKICKIEKEYSEFHKLTSSKDGHKSVCKICRKEEKRVYYEKNYDLISKYNTSYWLNNKDSITKKIKKWRAKNGEKVKIYHKRYNTKNKEKIKEKRKSEECRKKSNIRYERYKKNNPTCVIGRRLVKRCLNSYRKKYDTTFKILGYTPKQLRDRLEYQFKDGMTWDNYGQWHVDHKKPLSLFKKDTPINIMNALCNLQPMWAEENLKKNNKKIG